MFEQIPMDFIEGLMPLQAQHAYPHQHIQTKGETRESQGISRRTAVDHSMPSTAFIRTTIPQMN